MAENPTPQEQFDAPLTDHEYDGIREFDNPIPGWWNWIFIGTVIYSVLYFMAYQMGSAGTSVAEAYENEKTKVSMALIDLLGDLPVDEPTILANLNNQDLQAVGAGLFATNCVSCHAKDGQGLVGPNLTDEPYKNVKTLGDIGEVLMNGANNGAMPAWNNRLAPTEIVALSVYVANMRGQELPGRAPEGEAIAPWPDAPEAPAAPSE